MMTATEDWLPYVAYVLPLLIVAYAMSRNRSRKHSENAAIHYESVEAGLTAPPSLHPVIDPMRCIGCEACVHACPEYPEHKVLGVIRGKANLVSPSDCIGHGACKTVCPVDAIRLVFGTSERGVDIPALTPSFETNVSGIFVAGELGGMGLIRNAVEQGRQAIESLSAAPDFKRKRTRGTHDVVIVGAGPAGFAATLAAHEKQLDYVTLEQDLLGGTVAHFPRGKLVMTGPADLAIVGRMDFKHVDKESLMRFWKDAEAQSGIRINYQERVDAIDADDGAFIVTTTRKKYRTRSVLLALGRRGTPRQLGVPGEDLPKVVYRLVDPVQYTGKSVLVVGGGDSALEAALAVADAPETKVTVSYRADAFSRAKLRNRDLVKRASAAGKIDLKLSSNVVEIGSRHVVLDAAQRRAKLPNDQVIVCAGGVLPTDFLRRAGIQIETKYGTE
jgi:thioredoxin reductase/ferredoxin